MSSIMLRVDAVTSCHLIKHIKLKRNTLACKWRTSRKEKAWPRERVVRNYASLAAAKLM